MEHSVSAAKWRKSSYSGTDAGNCVEVGQAWRKSSYSGVSGNNCVEVGRAWRKSSYSDTGGGNCVEVGQAAGVVVRDTTDRAGAALAIPASAWRALLAGIRAS